jgi:Amt family ammonium transporter
MFAPPVAIDTDLFSRVARLAASTSTAQVAERLVAVLRLATAATVVGVRLGADECWHADPTNRRSVLRALATSHELDAALDSGLVLEVGSGTSGVIAAGLDRGVDRAPGIVVLAGPGIDVDLDGPRLSSMIEVTTGVLAQLDRVERATRAAEFDPATGLANRAGFERAVSEAASANRNVTVVEVHLGGISELAATFGASVARSVVRDVGGRISSLKGVDGVGSLAGDLLGVVALRDEGAIADQVVAAAGAPVSVGRQAVELRVNAGVAGGRGGDVPAAVLVERATLARVQAMATGAAIVVHTPSLTEGCHRRLDVAARLRRALEDAAITVHYQPQVGADGAILGLEALVRWVEEDGTHVPPDAFLSVAEQAGLLHEIDLRVLRSACAQLREWELEGLSDFRLAVNLSASTVSRPGIAAVVLGIVAEAGVDPGRIEVEITETTAADEAGWGVTLQQLRDAGISVAIDDFGTGFSSLGRIHRLPIDRLKIDRSFVADLAGAGRTVAAAVVALAAGLGLSVLAEGVEDDEQLAVLVDLGCTEFQGFGFSRPLPAGDAGPLLRRGGCR